MKLSIMTLALGLLARLSLAAPTGLPESDTGLAAREVQPETGLDARGPDIGTTEPEDDEEESRAGLAARGRSSKKTSWGDVFDQVYDHVVETKAREMAQRIKDSDPAVWGDGKKKSSSSHRHKSSKSSHRHKSDRDRK